MCDADSRKSDFPDIFEWIEIAIFSSIQYHQITIKTPESPIRCGPLNAQKVSVENSVVLLSMRPDQWAEMLCAVRPLDEARGCAWRLVMVTATW